MIETREFILFVHVSKVITLGEEYQLCSLNHNIGLPLGERSRDYMLGNLENVKFFLPYEGAF